MREENKRQILRSYGREGNNSSWILREDRKRGKQKKKRLKNPQILRMDREGE